MRTSVDSPIRLGSAARQRTGCCMRRQLGRVMDQSRR